MRSRPTRSCRCAASGSTRAPHAPAPRGAPPRSPALDAARPRRPACAAQRRVSGVPAVERGGRQMAHDEAEGGGRRPRGRPGGASRGSAGVQRRAERARAPCLPPHRARMGHAARMPAVCQRLSCPLAGPCPAQIPFERCCDACARWHLLPGFTVRGAPKDDESVAAGAKEDAALVIHQEDEGNQQVVFRLFSVS